jgi:hypothetical protein
MRGLPFLTDDGGTLSAVQARHDELGCATIE